MATLALVIGVSLALSFLCSVLEAVFLSVSHSYVALLEEKGSKAGRLLAGMRRRIDEPIAAILTLNTIAHTIGAALSGALALQLWGDRWVAVFSAVLTLAILVLSEIVPKTLGATYWQILAPATAYVLQAMVILLKPILVPLSWFNRLITPRRVGRPTVSRAELEVLAEIGRREGAIDEAEWRVVSNVINLDQIRVSEVMTPRTRMEAVEVNEVVSKAKALILETGHMRIPVYEGTLDSIVGVLLARDVWQADQEGIVELREVMREPRFVPEGKPVEDLLPELRKERINLAIVVDEYGGTAGIVTLEDLIEEIVGEIQDEHEIEPLAFEEVEEGEVRIAGQVPVWEVNERFGLRLPEDIYETIGGFIFGHLGRIGRPGDDVAVEGGVFRVVAMDGRRIARVSFVPGMEAREEAD